MAANDEDQQIRELVGRLTDKFPGVGAGVVADIVADFHRGFEGRPVRDFVPLLVERMVTRKLDSTAR
ncbi:three-helix bundle dimerization domain-containing protein [Nocardia tengchongensis]|uniref:three-helix bundle dimerization domain-containing protein n=1 Tax=Nocardia tengchongensis TaxID=2055889 RepID=UPI0036A1F535